MVLEYNIVVVVKGRVFVQVAVVDSKVEAHIEEDVSCFRVSLLFGSW